MELFLAGNLEVPKLVTHTYCLSEIDQAPVDLEEGKVGRALIRMTSEK